MKLPEKIIKALKGKVNYKEVPEDAWYDDTWKLDDEPYYKEKDCWKLHNDSGAWIEIPCYLMNNIHPNKQNNNFDLDRACNWLNKNLSRVIPCYVQNENSNIEGDTRVVDRLKEDILSDFREYMKKPL